MHKTIKNFAIFSLLVIGAVSQMNASSDTNESSTIPSDQEFSFLPKPVLKRGMNISSKENITIEFGNSITTTIQAVQKDLKNVSGEFTGDGQSATHRTFEDIRYADQKFEAFLKIPQSTLEKLVGEEVFSSLPSPRLNTK